MSLIIVKKKLYQNKVAPPVDDDFIDINPPSPLESYVQNFNYGSMVMYRKQPASVQGGFLKSVTIKGKGEFMIYRISIDGYRFYLETVDTGNVNKVSAVNLVGDHYINPGEYVGLSIVGSGEISIKNPGEEDNYTFRFDTGTIGYYTMAYSYKLNITKNRIKSPDSFISSPDSFSTIYSANFAIEPSDWTKTGWNFSNGKYTSSSLGINNVLFFNKIWNIHKRFVKFKIKPSFDTDFRIHLNSTGPSNNNFSEGASMFGINFNKQSLNIYSPKEALDGDPDISGKNVDTTYALKSVQSVPFISGHEYEIELWYLETLHQLKIKNLTTLQTATINLNGWKAGRQQQNYGFYVNSGGSVEFSNFSLSAVSGVKTLFVGDSITEGVMVKDKTKRWWKLMQNNLLKKSEVSARGGHTTSHILDKFDHEILPLNIETLVILIGINNNAVPTSDYTALLNKCLANGIRPIFCYLTCYNNGQQVTAQNNILSVISQQYRGFRFDIATSIDGGGINYNPVLFYDGLHPIESGCALMAGRLNIDKDSNNNNFLTLK